MVSGLVEGRTGGLEYQRGVGCLDSGGFREGGLMCDSWLLEELVLGALSPPQAGKSSVLCVRLSFRGGCWRELRRSLSSLTPSPSPRPPKHGVLPPRTTATSVCREEFEINVPLRETVGAIKVLATFRVASLETAATALRAPWRERRSVVRPEIRQLAAGAARQLRRTAAREREESILGICAVRNWQGQRCGVKWQQVGARREVEVGFAERFSKMPAERHKDWDGDVMPREHSVGQGHVTYAAIGKGDEDCSLDAIGG